MALLRVGDVGFVETAPVAGSEPTSTRMDRAGEAVANAFRSGAAGDLGGGDVDGGHDRAAVRAFGAAAAGAGAGAKVHCEGANVIVAAASGEATLEVTLVYNGGLESDEVLSPLNAPPAPLSPTTAPNRFTSRSLTVRASACRAPWRTAIEQDDWLRATARVTQGRPGDALVDVTAFLLVNDPAVAELKARQASIHPDDLIATQQTSRDLAEHRHGRSAVFGLAVAAAEQIHDLPLSAPYRFQLEDP